MPRDDFNKVQNNFTEIKLRHACSPVNLPYIFRKPFPKNTFGGVLLSGKLSCFLATENSTYLK